MLSRHFSCLMLSVSRDGYCFIVNCIHYRSASSRNHLSHGVCVYLRMFHSFRWINATMTVVRHRLPHSLIRLIKSAIFKLCILLAMACIVSNSNLAYPYSRNVLNRVTTITNVVVEGILYIRVAAVCASPIFTTAKRNHATFPLLQIVPIRWANNSVRFTCSKHQVFFS